MEATLQGFEGMEALGRKKRKAKRPRPSDIRWITSFPPAVPPSVGMQQYNPASKVDALPPPPPPEYVERMPRVVPAKGHSDRNNFINSGLDVLDRFVNKGNAGGSDGGYNYSVPAPRIDSGDNRAGTDIGRKAGGAAGNLADAAGDIVSQHPMAVLGTVVGLGLLLFNPFGGKKR